MKLYTRLALVLLMVGGLVVQAHLVAGDKKADKEKPDKEKKKEEPFKDVVVDGELINADLKDKVFTNSYCKSYTFKMEKGKSYQISLNTHNLWQGVLRLEDADGKQITQGIGQGGNQGGVILYQPTKTEDHEIVVTSPNTAALGKFTLTIMDASKTLVLSVKDKLDQNDKAYAGAGNKKHKMFLAELQAGKTYQLDMVSDLNNGGFDSYLFFESPGGKLLAQDDDGGGYPNARIIHKATETGKYRIICTYFGGAGAGPFNLTVRQTDGGAVPNINFKDGFKDKKE